MQKHQWLSELFQKSLQGEGRMYTPLKNNFANINKTLDARGGPRIFKHFKFLLMHSWMLCPPHLVPDIEYFARIN